MKWVKTFESFLNETNFGTLIKKSQFHSIYQDPKNRDRVIKVGQEAVLHGKIFKENPEYCPIVYEIHEDENPLESYIIIEKLNTEKAIADYDNLINAEIGYVHNWGYKTFKNTKSFNDVRSRITTKEGQDMFDRVRDIVLAIEMKDIHARNFGYDKNMKLKALDI